MRGLYVRRYDSTGRGVDYEPFNRPYGDVDYIVYKKNDKIRAKNTDSGRIEFRDVELHNVLNSIASLYNNELVSIAFKPDTYALNGKVSFTAGVQLYGNGSVIDISNLDDVAFEVNYGSYTVPDIMPTTVIQDLNFVGDNTKTGQVAIQAVHIARGLVIKDIQMYNVTTGVKLLGKCYVVLLDKIHGRQVGDFIVLNSYSGTGYVYSPLGVTIRACELTSASGSGISILDEAADVKIYGCWLEGASYGVYAPGGGDNLRITDTLVSGANSVGIYISDIKGLSIKGSYVKIKDDETIAIYLINSAGSIADNRIIATASDNTGLQFSGFHGNIIGNMFDFTAVTGGTNMILSGNAPKTRIEGNYFAGTTSQTCIVGKLTYSDYIVVIGNTVNNATNFVYGNGTDYALVANNNLNNVTGDLTFSKQTNYMDYVTYTSLPDTSSSQVSNLFKNRPITVYDSDGSITGTADSYWLFVWDGSTWRKVQLT